MSDKLRRILRGLFIFGGMMAGWVVVPSFVVAADQPVPAVVFPFLGETITDNVNVRSGQSVNYDQVGRLFKGEKVIVFAEENGWYKIRLPGNTDHFISSQYVKVISKGEGEVIGDRVNVRLGPGTEFPVITQSKQGTMIRIIETVNGWHKFESPADTYGWAAKEYVNFLSNDVHDIEQSVIFTRSGGTSSSGVSAQVDSSNSVASGQTVKYTGVVQRQELGDFKEARFKLAEGDSTVCFLIGPAALIDDFLRYKVEVEGTIYAEESQNYPFPVVHVEKIQLIL